ncbi:MAG: hypothetical protein AAFX79_03375 [Planctomycetota bacterium]
MPALAIREDFVNALGGTIDVSRIDRVIEIDAGGSVPSDAPIDRGELLAIRDADRPLADAAKHGLHAWLHCAGGAGAASWWFGARTPAGEAVRTGDALPPIVSFYTAGTPYEDEAADFRESCNALGLEHHVASLPPRGTWEANCAMKAEFVRSRWRESKAGVAWVDIDARFACRPLLFGATEVDFAIHRYGGWQFASGTALFGATPAAGQLLDAWCAQCAERPDRWDQLSLDVAWESHVRRAPLRTLWLPGAYTKIVDAAKEDETAGDPVLVHHQASRRHKASVSGGRRGPPPEHSADLIRARRAARPRTAMEH